MFLYPHHRSPQIRPRDPSAAARRYSTALGLALAALLSGAPALADNAPIFDATGRLLAKGAPGSPGAEVAPGVTDFLPNIRVDDDINPEHREPVAAWGPGGVLYCAYAERATHWNPELILFSRSEDGGLTWLDPAVLVNDTQPNAVIFPAIGVLPDGAIVLVWAELKFAPYNYEIRFSRSEDGGETWSPSTVIHPLDPSTDFMRPSLLVVGNRILAAYWEEVAYPDGRPLVVYSDDRGESWSPPVLITTMLCDYGGSAPCLAYNDATGLLGVIVPTHSEIIYFLASEDLGDTWSPAVRVNDAAATSADYPDLAAGAGLFWAVWTDNRYGPYDTDIWISSSGSGESWSANQKVNDDIIEGNQYEPHLRLDPYGNVHVCWIWCIPFGNNIDLYYSISTDGGGSWLPQAQRVNDIPYTVQPYVAWTSDLLVDNRGVFVFWNDGRATGYYDNIYFSRQLDASSVGPGDVSLRAPLTLMVQGQPGPNPRLHLRLPAPGRLVLDLLDVSGRCEGSWAAELASGEHQISLSQLTGDGFLAPGIYFARARQERTATAGRLVILR